MFFVSKRVGLINLNDSGIFLAPIGMRAPLVKKQCSTGFETSFVVGALTFVERKLTCFHFYKVSFFEKGGPVITFERLVAIQITSQFLVKVLVLCQ